MTRRLSHFADGVRFGCTGCGACCTTHGDYAYVYLTEQDVAAISAHLHMAPVDFLNAHCRSEDGLTVLTMVEGACNFLLPDNRCAVYPVRPMQCATWPFWSENLDPTVWENEIVPFCEGIGKGRLYTLKEIRAAARRRDRHYGIDFASD